MTYGMSTEQPAGVVTGSPGADGRGRNQWVFHVVAFLVCAATSVAAVVAVVIVSFGTSTCNDADTSDELGQLRLGLAVIGVVLTAVPVVFAVVAHKLRFVWVPWAALAVLAAGTALNAVSSAEVSTWCLF